jgi:hypothetical protein
VSHNKPPTTALENHFIKILLGCQENLIRG